MPEYLLAYHGGKTPATPEEGEKAMAAWTAWFTDLGESVVNPGNPVGKSSTVSRDGVVDNGGANPLSGFTILRAATIEEATTLAGGCPMVASGDGTVEVAQIHEM